MTSSSQWQERKDLSSRSVRLSGRDLDDATRLLKLLAAPAEGAPEPGASRRAALIEAAGQDRQPPPAGRGTRAALIEAARQEMQRRRLRTNLLPDGMFGEDAWEMLLQLYIEQQGARFTIARLSSSLGIPTASAVRWLQYLQAKQLVRREDHPTDRRAVFIMLTSEGMDALDAYFSSAIAAPQ
jgi:hypothetical protein